MPLDPRSRERLEALGRSLPQPLPAPKSPPRSRTAADTPRHAVETEQDPEQLFRELMAASPDGRVPPHLLDRLRQLEQSRVQPRRIPATARASGSATGRSSAPSATTPDPDLELYEAFEDLLRLADDNDRDQDNSPAGRMDRSASQQLRPQPSQRPRRP